MLAVEALCQVLAGATLPDGMAAARLIRTLRHAVDAPWKAKNAVGALALLPATRIAFAVAGIPWSSGGRCMGLPILQKYRGSTLTLGARFDLRSTTGSNAISPDHPVVLSTRAVSASLIIGEDFAMTGGSLIAAQELRIGDRVMIGANTLVTDTDFHPIDFDVRRREPTAGASAPVRIEDDVFVGARCIVLKGVTLGRGCAIGAGSVVTRSIPAGAVAAGNPAVVLREHG